MLKTFHQWSSEGYKIKKGEKARGKTSEGFMFDESQVTYSPRSGYKGMSYAHNSRSDWTEDDYEADLIFGAWS